jgi:hypothetical protein
VALERRVLRRAPSPARRGFSFVEQRRDLPAVSPLAIDMVADTISRCSRDTPAAIDRAAACGPVSRGRLYPPPEIRLISCADIICQQTHSGTAARPPDHSDLLRNSLPWRSPSLSVSNMMGSSFATRKPQPVAPLIPRTVRRLRALPRDVGSFALWARRRARCFSISRRELLRHGYEGCSHIAARDFLP